MFKVSRAPGHSSVTITERYYASGTPRTSVLQFMIFQNVSRTF
jgi:hypothetical protein